MGLQEPYRANHFIVEIDGIQSPAIDNVTGLSLGETGTIEHVDGGTNLVDKISSGIVKFEPLVLTKAIKDDQAFQDLLDWFKEMFNYLGPIQSQGSRTRRNGAVIKKEFDEDKWRIAFVGGWIKSFKMGDVDTASEELWKATITIEHQGMYAEQL